MKTREIGKKFTFSYTDATVVLIVEEFTSGSRCGKCEFRKAERHSMTGFISSWGCRLNYSNTACGVPNNEREDGKQVYYSRLYTK